MAKYQVDFSGARNIIDPLEGVRNSLQQTNATIGQMIGQDEQRAERLRDEAYRRDALALQQTAAQREADKYNQELADRAFAQKTFAAYNQTPIRDYSALPSQLTDTDRGKAVIEAMSLTPEELANPTMPSAIAKMKNQQILSAIHNKSGQTMLESERFKNAMAATAKDADGMIPLSMQEKLLGMESAERTAMAAKSERAQKAIEELSKDKGTIELNALKSATTLSAEETKANSRGSGNSGGGKNDSKEPKTPSWEDYDKYREKLYKDYAYTKLWDAKDVDTVMDRAEALGVKPDDLNKIIKANTERKWDDNTFRTEQVLTDLEAKKPVLTGGGYAGSTTKTPGKFASLDPMAGYAELLKQKDAAYRQAVANAANMPLTQADVLAAREAKGAAQLDELIAKLGATTSKAEVKPETRNVPAPVTAVEEKPVKTNNTKKMASDGLNKDGTLNKEAWDAVNESIAYTGKRLPERVTSAEANIIVDTLLKDSAIRGYDKKSLGFTPLTNTQKEYMEFASPSTRSSTVDRNAEWYPNALQVAKKEAERTGDEWAYVVDPNTKQIVETVPGKAPAMEDTSGTFIPLTRVGQGMSKMTGDTLEAIASKKAAEAVKNAERLKPFQEAQKVREQLAESLRLSPGRRAGEPILPIKKVGDTAKNVKNQEEARLKLLKQLEKEKRSLQKEMKRSGQ